MTKLKVRKWDGRIEPFKREKIVISISEAGLKREEAEKIAIKTEEWARRNATEEVIESIELRAKTLFLLARVNPEIAKRYVEFRRNAKKFKS